MSKCISIEFQPFSTFCAFGFTLCFHDLRIWKRKYHINFSSGCFEIKTFKQQHGRNGAEDKRWDFERINICWASGYTFQEGSHLCGGELPWASKLTPFFIPKQRNFDEIHYLTEHTALAPSLYWRYSHQNVSIFLLLPLNTEQQTVNSEQWTVGTGAPKPAFACCLHGMHA